MLPLFILTTLLFSVIAVFFAYQLDIRQEKDKHQEEMNLFMIHELRSPLSSIKAATSLLLHADNKMEKKTTDAMLTLINTQTIRVLDYISILLDTARYESGTFSIQSKPNDIKNILQERIGLLKPLSIEKDLHISLKIEQPVPAFRFDKEYISHVIDNLLYNAVKFTPKNGKINICVELKHTFVSVTIENTGGGMSKEQQGSLFSKFSQTTKSFARGSGLGLYFVKGIVEAHGGKVGVTSKDDTTTISFSLPFIPERAA